MNSQEMMYQQINKLCESFESLKEEVNNLNIKFNDFENRKKFMNTIYGWVGAAVIAVVGTDAFLDLITNHIRL